MAAGSTEEGGSSPSGSPRPQRWHQHAERWQRVEQIKRHREHRHVGEDVRGNFDDAACRRRWDGLREQRHNHRDQTVAGQHVLDPELQPLYRSVAGDKDESVGTLDSSCSQALRDFHTLDNNARSPGFCRRPSAPRAPIKPSAPSFPSAPTVAAPRSGRRWDNGNGRKSDVIEEGCLSQAGLMTKIPSRRVALPPLLSPSPSPGGAGSGVEEVELVSRPKVLGITEFAGSPVETPGIDVSLPAPRSALSAFGSPVLGEDTFDDNADAPLVSSVRSSRSPQGGPTRALLILGSPSSQTTPQVPSHCTPRFTRADLLRRQREREERKIAAAELAATLRFQSFYRGRRVRIELRRQGLAASCIQRQYRRHLLIREFARHRLVYEIESKLMGCGNEERLLQLVSSVENIDAPEEEFAMAFVRRVFAH